MNWSLTYRLFQWVTVLVFVFGWANEFDTYVDSGRMTLDNVALFVVWGALIIVLAYSTWRTQREEKRNVG